MKFTKILALAVASLMLALVLVSCGGGNAGFEVNVKITTNDAANPTLFDGPVTVGGDGSVLAAIEAACEAEGLYIEFNSAGDAVEAIEDYATKKNDDGTVSYWYSVVDRKDANGDDILEAGQKLEYIYGTSESKNVNFIVYVDDEPVIDEVVPEGLLENIIDVACDGSYSVAEDGKTIDDIGDWETKEDGGFSYYWVYKLDGKKVAKYNVEEDEIYGGSVVEFYYEAEEIEE